MLERLLSIHQEQGVKILMIDEEKEPDQPDYMYLRPYQTNPTCPSCGDVYDKHHDARSRFCGWFGFRRWWCLRKWGVVGPHVHYTCIGCGCKWVGHIYLNRVVRKVMTPPMMPLAEYIYETDPEAQQVMNIREGEHERDVAGATMYGGVQMPIQSQQQDWNRLYQDSSLGKKNEEQKQQGIPIAEPPGTLLGYKGQEIPKSYPDRIQLPHVPPVSLPPNEKVSK